MERSEEIRLKKISDNWSSKTGANGEFVKYSYSNLKSYFKGDLCLELGSADGQMTQFLVNNFKRVVAVDGSEKFVNELKEWDISNLEPICSLFEEFSFGEKFDTIVMAHILEHVDDPIQVLKLGRSLLKEDGVLLVDVPNANSLHRLAAVKMGLLKQKDQLNNTDHMLGHRRVYTSELMKEHIKMAELNLASWGGHFLKTVSNAQMEKNWNREMMDAYYELGKEFPENAAEIYFVCKK
jgi:2-polyprenyl-3-methyl-5-hydroxy-6-metoxy-1,4-benzoquinol methylase